MTTTPDAWRDDYGSEDWLWETAADAKEDFWHQCSDDEGAEQAASDGWRP